MCRNNRLFWVLAGVVAVVLPAFIVAAYQRWRDGERTRLAVRIYRAISDELDARTSVVQPPAAPVADVHVVQVQPARVGSPPSVELPAQVSVTASAT